MPSITHIKKARKSPGSCTACGKTIEPGQAYKWFAHFRSSANCRHEDCPTWRPSQMCGSQYESNALAAIENAEDAIKAWDGRDADELKSIIDDIKSEIEDAASEYEDGAQNIEDSFQHETEQSQEMREKAESLQDVANNIESLTIEDIDVYVEEARPEEPAPVEGETPAQSDERQAAYEKALKEWEERNEEQLNEWAKAQRDAIREELANADI